MRVWILTLLSALGLCAAASSGAVADPPVGRVLSVKVGGEGGATRGVVDSEQGRSRDEAARARHGKEVAQIVGADIQRIGCGRSHGFTLRC